MQLSRNLETPWWTLRLALGLTAFLAGADKFTDLLTNWPAYLSPLVARVVSTGQYFDVAVRDLVMAAAAFSLAKLSEAREPERAAVTSVRTTPVPAAR
jgi:hypothetical protein